MVGRGWWREVGREWRGEEAYLFFPFDLSTAEVENAMIPESFLLSRDQGVSLVSSAL